MILEKLKKIADETLKKYFDEIHKMDLQSSIEKKNGVLLYPTLLLIIKTDKHYILELFGASTKHRSLNIRIVNCNTSSNYLYQFHTLDHKAIFNFDAKDNSIENLLFSDGDNLGSSFAVELFEESKYPQILRENGEGSLIDFGEKFKSCALFNCLIRNKYRSFVRIKYILAMVIIDKRMQIREFQKTFHNFLHNAVYELRGVSLSRPEDITPHLLLAGFQSLYLVNKINETVITQFLAEHPEILLQAFNAKKLISERNFVWQEPKNEKTIRPDFLIQRMDGYWDIVDFKLPLLNKESITVNSQRNRRFIAYVEDGLSQLANYREYFLNEKNLNYLKKNFQVEFSNPNYILVVGHNENVNKDDIKQAARKIRDEITVVDYDSIVGRNLGALLVK